ILASIQAESKTAAETPAEEETPAAEAAPVAAKAPAAVKAPAVKEVAASFTPTASKQKALPDNLMGWMSARYGSKTMLGLKWENPNKAKNQFVAENNAALAYSLANPGMQAGFRRRSAAAVKGPAASLDIALSASFMSDSLAEPVTNSYLDVKYRQNAKPGGFTSWSINYLKYSVSDELWDDTNYVYLPQTTEASVLSATLVLAMPSAFSIYGFAGPAMVSYDRTVLTAKESGTATTWMAGMGYSLKSPKSGFGIFVELKHVAEAGAYPGMTTGGMGVTIGF
ncbi:MAG: hypothetical protein Q7R35_16670, partial [Elusimicrobiota bacterium]|nr:hypothetical protein [Elusimicrobiota bacterium]